ncbi:MULTISPECIES: 3-oxoacyl-ACP synthase [unclassified Streptomyces]|uniref:3-oxoacyl-ACP synthase n=1 Tax=unclassified Streptomyces TaxID=2593676 RepID=UPI002481DCF7|nr:MULTISPECIES: 3-oxoacyl-ACP synthase [unclassified Streptomyces]MDA5280847.1 3-oxoacyl-ACP synthase [Streptomyces sp. Isolate_45]MDX2396335.1 3-oxoacyl-ACP synthase [Streptomyces sp. DK15]
MGAVAAVGSGVDALFESVCAGRSGRARLRGFDRSRFTAQHAYEVDDRPVGGGDVPGRATRLLLDAVGQAAEDAGLGDDLSGIPILVGTGMREMRSLELWWRDGSPFADSGLNFGAALRERFRADITHTFSNGCSASLYALALASDLLGQEGDDAPEHVIVAGVDVVTESMYGLAERVRPYGGTGRSVSLGDGAAAIVLRRTGGDAARVHGRLRGVSLSCDAHHVTAPSRDGIAEVMRSAYRLAGVRPGDVDLVMLHGDGTPGEGDAEAAALAEVFGTDEAAPLMTAVKSMTGQTLGAAGLIDLIVGIRALGEGRVPTIAWPRGTTDDAPPRFVTGAAAEGQRMNVAQLNAFGLGGINAVAIVEGGP